MSIENRRSCDTCGAEEGGDIKIRTCTACKWASYCSTDCQRKDWKAHKPSCKKIQAESRAAEPPSHRDIEKARAALGKLLDDSTSEAEKFRITSEFAEQDMSLLKAGLAYDPGTIVPEEGDDSDSFAPYDLYDTLAELSRRDTALLKKIAAESDPDRLIPSIFPSHHLYLAVVRWRPTEPDYKPGPDPRGPMMACPKRSADYLGRHFPVQLELCAAAWDASRSSKAALYHVCKDLWRMLPISLCDGRVAEAVLRSHGPFTAESLADLTRMFELNGEGNDLEGLTNQTAAVLFCQARRINRKVEREGAEEQWVQNADDLLQIFTSNFDEAQMAAWRGLSVPVADEMCRLERGLSGAEFGKAVQTVGFP